VTQIAIQPTGIHTATGYSHAVRAGDTLYVSGQVPRDRDNRMVGAGDFEAQARQVYANLRRVLEAAGGGFENLVKVTAFLTDQGDFETWRRVREGVSSEPPPASTLVIVAGLSHPEYLIEVEAVAVLG
jgi:reactive intermediate/imine deaminase